MARWVFLLLAFSFSVESFAAKKDFKGLFGNYRRERFTENEGNQSDFGIDLNLSTLLPLTPLIQSAETGLAQAGLQYSQFFNAELGFTFSMGYHWEFFATAGYYAYDTRKENTLAADTDPTGAAPFFHVFTMTSIPVLGGVRYRFGTEDIVPYIGAGAGVSFVKRRASYDYDPATFEEANLTVLTAQVTVGLEFYFAPRAGIRLESSALFMAMPSGTFSPGTVLYPTFFYQANAWSIRYASGIFVLF